MRKEINVCMKCNSSQIRQNLKRSWKCYSCGYSSRDVNKRLSKHEDDRGRKKLPSNNIPTYNELINTIKQMSAKKNPKGMYTSVDPIRDLALASFLYLTGMRIQEVCGLSKTLDKDTTVYFVKPLIKEQVVFTTVNKHPIMLIRNAPTLKRRRTTSSGKKVREDHRRNIPILIEHDVELVEYIKNHLSRLKKGQALFPGTYQKKKVKIYVEDANPQGGVVKEVERIKNRFKGELPYEPWMDTIHPRTAYDIVSHLTARKFYPHFFRHCRCSHLVTKYNFTGQHLQKFIGWSTLNMTSKYVHLNPRDLIDRMAMKDE